MGFLDFVLSGFGSGVGIKSQQYTVQQNKTLPLEQLWSWVMRSL